MGVVCSDAFMYYAGGILNDAKCSNESSKIGHAVTLVGWGTDSEVGEYWIVRNSWGKLWGVDGYIYIQMKDNICAVSAQAVYPVVKKK